MNTGKRALIKLAIVGSLAGGIIGMPLVAFAQANPNEGFNNCRGVSISQEGAPLGKNFGLFGHAENVKEAQLDLKSFCSGPK